MVHEKIQLAISYDFQGQWNLWKRTMAFSVYYETVKNSSSENVKSTV